jgi:hypothetical protein
MSFSSGGVDGTLVLELVAPVVGSVVAVFDGALVGRCAELFELLHAAINAPASPRTVNSDARDRRVATAPS